MSEVRDGNILITGGASGIGRLVSLELARLGGRLVVWDNDPTGLDRVIAEINSVASGCARGYVCDVSNREHVYRTADRVKHDVGTIQILVNSAGVVSGKSFLDLSDAQIERTLGVNTMALFWMAKAFLPDMVAAGEGHVVTIASAAGVIGVAGLSDYCASKWAAVGLDESLRVELRRQSSGVKTTVVCPYFVNTGMFQGVRTRLPWLLPLLKEDDVAVRIVRAIQRNQSRVTLPWLVRLVPLMRVLPTICLDTVAGWLGINEAMESFHGRSTDRDNSDRQSAAPHEVL